MSLSERSFVQAFVIECATNPTETTSSLISQAKNTYKRIIEATEDDNTPNSELFRGPDGNPVGAGSLSELKSKMRDMGFNIDDNIDSGFKKGNCGMEYGQYVADALQARGAKVDEMGMGMGSVDIRAVIDGVKLIVSIKQED